MKLTWIGKRRFSPGYGILEYGNVFDAKEADGKDFIRQGLAVEDRPERKKTKTDKDTKE